MHVHVHVHVHVHAHVHVCATLPIYTRYTVVPHQLPGEMLLGAGLLHVCSSAAGSLNGYGNGSPTYLARHLGRDLTLSPVLRLAVAVPRHPSRTMTTPILRMRVAARCQPPTICK